MVRSYVCLRRWLRYDWHCHLDGDFISSRSHGFQSRQRSRRHACPPSTMDNVNGTLYVVNFLFFVETNYISFQY